MFEMSMVPQMGMRVTPALLNLTRLLTLPTLALQQAVEQELNENPALEEIEAQDSPCFRCGGPTYDGVCVRCEAQSSTYEPTTAQNGDEETDPLLFIAAPRSLSESLLADLYASLPTSEHTLALALVGSLDDQGFLADELEDIAVSLGVAVERVQAVLIRLRELGPPGIATRDSRECMLAQLTMLEGQGIGNAYARAIILDHFEDLGARRYKQIAKALGVNAEAVAEAREFITQHLWPYPAQSALSDGKAANRTRYRTPDMAIMYHQDEDAFNVEVLNSPRRMLRLNPLYQELARNATELGEEERLHVQEYVARARVFLANLRQRESTLKRIGEAIVERQRDFLLHGVRHLNPMTRAEIATELSLHESTISRATADKTTTLPNGSLLPISEFFVAARNVQDVLRELIANELNPLSDQELAEMLSERGYPIARRTVAKYRDQLKIPPSHLRA
ncbi:RNA polymerase factor sigma-54 [Candidatus Gracilibacteria bacterium]|nr:RNA polymerase factor sigma-54 [Candidatus Gracilibacteria bacterium]